MNGLKQVLITGATGRHGGTGALITKELVDRGLAVRVLVRTRDARADALARLGAEMVIGDFNDYSSLLAALVGVEAAYFCYPVNAGIAEAAGRFAAAGREQGLKRVVHMSMAPSHQQSPSPLGRAQWVAEQILDWAGFRCVHLRVAAFFMENLLLLHGLSIRNEGVIRNPFGGFEANWIAGADAAAMSASLLANPDQLFERVIYPTGGERMTHPQVAETIKSVLGRTVSYEKISPDAWRAELNAMVGAVAGVNPAMIDHITALSIALPTKTAPSLTDHFRRLTGREPTTLAQFVVANREQLTNTEIVHE
jgi:NAD(P)H dehydrogenase (quinone)